MFEEANKSYNKTSHKDEILKIAIDNKIDGILTYGSDISTNTVGYIAKKMNLSGAEIQTINTLNNKSKEVF